MAETFHETVVEALEKGESPAGVALRVARAADRALEWQTKSLLGMQDAHQRAMERELVLSEAVREMLRTDVSPKSVVEVKEAHGRWSRMRYGGQDPVDAGSAVADSQGSAALDGRGSGAAVDDGPQGAGAGGDGAAGAP